MSALSLLAELEAAGVTVERDGETLRITGKKRSVAAFAERIRENKPALLAALGDKETTESQTVPDPRVLTAAESEALGLDPALQWIRVYTGPVDAAEPREGWDGTLPAECGWPNLCRQLGPCPRHFTGRPCRIDRSDS